MAVFVLHASPNAKIPRRAAPIGSASVNVEAIAGGVVFRPLTKRENAQAAVITPSPVVTANPLAVRTHETG